MGSKKSGGYGYFDRADQPDRVVPVPSQAMPISDLPKSVETVVKDPGTSVPELYQIFYARQFNGEELVRFGGGLEAGATGGGGTPTSANDQWYARIGRYCATKSHHHTTGGMGFQEDKISLDQSIWALLATDAPGAPFVLRAEDIIAGELTFVGSGSIAIHFGFRSNVAAINTLVPNGAFVGFYCAAVDTAAYPVWNCGVWADGGAAVKTFATAITCELPHHLRIDIDAQAGEARFYIDQTLVYTATGITGTFSQINDDGSLSWILCCGGTGAHTADATMGCFMEQANLSVRILDEAA